MTHHFISQMPLRVSALRSLGAYMNIFAIESFMDEMAVAANADPIEFRLKHLEDTRAKDVIETVADRFDWKNWRKAGPHHGRGFAFAKSKTLPPMWRSLLIWRWTAKPAEFASAAQWLLTIAARPSTPTASKIKLRGRSCRRRAGLCRNGLLSTARASRVETGRHIHPALRGRFPQRRGVRHRQAESALSRHRRGGQGPTAAAIANALADATGQRFASYRLPARA